MDIELEEGKIYVSDKNEVFIAHFEKDDRDPIINPRIEETQNSEAVFTFSISPNNPKWKDIQNPENLFWVNGKVFSPNFEGCYTETLADNDERLVSVKAYERQKLLDRKYVKAYNSLTFPDDDSKYMQMSDFKVFLRGNGTIDNEEHLFVEKYNSQTGQMEDTEIIPTYPVGTSGYVLEALLADTDWTVGLCDIYDADYADFKYAVFDFETDMTTIYENILKVQEMFGGILVFDSLNKVIHHRDETLYFGGDGSDNSTGYQGYEVKYQKNMESLEKTYNNKIITKLCPVGSGGRGIASVNEGSKWLIDTTYTNSIFEGIESNPDIEDLEQLKKWGQRRLKDLCKPRKELTVQMVLLSELEAYKLETIGLNDVVDVIDYGGIEGTIEQLRVTRFEHGLWDLSDAVIDLGNITLDSTDIFKKTVQATNIINDGTLNTKHTVVYGYGNGSLDDVLGYFYTTEVTRDSWQEKTTETIADNFRVQTEQISELDEKVVGFNTELTTIKESIEGLGIDKYLRGGKNLIKNSVGFFGNEHWTSTRNIVSLDTTNIEQNNISDKAISLQNTTITQKISKLKTGTYYLSFNYRKMENTAIASVKINDNETNLDGSTSNWKNFETTIYIDGDFTISFTCNINNGYYISDLILSYGKDRILWEQNANEVMTDTIQIGDGIQVTSNRKNTYTRLDADGLRIFNKDIYDIESEKDKAIVSEFTEEGTETDMITAKVGKIGYYTKDSNGNKNYTSGIIIQSVEGQTWISSL